jgi:hypothetical protein
MKPVHIVNPIEYSLVQWLDGHPESGHPLDMRRFYRFVKTVCRHRTTRWRDAEFVRAQIMSLRPSFNKRVLDQFMDLFSHLVDFNSSIPFEGGLSSADMDVSDDHYLEIRVRGGTVSTKALLLSEYGERNRKKLKESEREHDRPASNAAGRPD